MGLYQHGLTGAQRDIPDEEAPGVPWYRVADSPVLVKTEAAAPKKAPPSKKKR